MQIFIATRRSEAVPIEISETATVSDLKKKISMILPDFKVTDQRLNFKRKILLSTDKVLKSGIQENSVIDLLRKKRKNIIFIQMVNNVVQKLKVHDFATNINAIKKQISEILHIPVEYQQLYINKIELHNNDILSDKMIGPETILKLIYAELKIRMQLFHGCPGAYRQISLPSNSKLFQIKEHVEAIYNIPMEDQTLYFNGQKLDVDENTLMDYKILNNSCIKIKKDDFEIIIETQFFKPKNIPLRVFPSETVKQVKDKIESYMKWNSIEQKLFWGNSLLHDCDILREKGIISGSYLYLFILPHPVYLSIQTKTAQNIRIICQTTETVGQLKEKIERATQIPIANQVLYSNKKMWSKGPSCLLMKLSLNETSNIVLEKEKTIQIFVKSLNGKTITLVMNKSHTLDDIMFNIEKSQGYPTDGLWITCFGKRLDSERSIESYGIKAEATLNLLCRLYSCYS